MKKVKTNYQLAHHNFKFVRLFVLLVFLNLVCVPTTIAQNWENLPGHAKEIGAGGDSTDIIWTIGRDDGAYRWNEATFTWQTFGGKSQMITVTNNGVPWVVNRGQIYRLRGQVWQSIPGRATTIASGGGEVWLLGNSGIVYKWDEDTFSWQSFGGKAIEIAVTSDGIPWVINDQQIYRLRGHVWQNMPGKAKAIGAGGGEVWVIGESNAVYRWNEDAFTWSSVGGKASRIAVGGTGTPYVIADTGTLVYRLRGWK